MKLRVIYYHNGVLHQKVFHDEIWLTIAQNAESEGIRHFDIIRIERIPEE